MTQFDCNTWKRVGQSLLATIPDVGEVAQSFKSGQWRNSATNRTWNQAHQATVDIYSARVIGTSRKEMSIVRTGCKKVTKKR